MRKSVFTRQYAVLIERLIDARTAAQLTQQALADQLGRPQSYVAKYENAERRLDVVEFKDNLGGPETGEAAAQNQADKHLVRCPPSFLIGLEN